MRTILNRALCLQRIRENLVDALQVPPRTLARRILLGNVLFYMDMLALVED